MGVVHLAHCAHGILRLGIDLLHDVGKAVGLRAVQVVDVKNVHEGLGLEGHVLVIVGGAVLRRTVDQLQIRLVAGALVQQVHVALDQGGGGGFPQLGFHLVLQAAAGRQRQQGAQGQHQRRRAFEMFHGVAPFLSLDNSFIP